MAINKEFAKKLNELMDAKGIRPADLSKKTGIKPSQISRYRKGQMPDAKTIERLAGPLGARMEDFYKTAESAGHQKDINKMKLDAISAIATADSAEILGVWSSLSAIVDTLGSNKQQFGG